MNFIDHVQITVVAGKGGDGKLSFRHEKFIDRGGPDGGDGGDGADVVFVASSNRNTLVQFRYQKELKAEAGQPGGKKRMHGRSGEALRVAVPVGTLVRSGEAVLADLTEVGQEAVIARGGKGGFGNAHFTSSTRQAPKFAEKGEAGEALELDLELKMIADVGLVGLPNAGKSTLLSVISNARPGIADYPFTTLTPNLGVVTVDDETTLLFADIPGLIEGAAEGKGLGDEFLRHVERTAVLVHLVDVNAADIAADYRTIQQELKSYGGSLAGKPQLVALSKIDTAAPAVVATQTKLLQKALPKGTKLFAISSQAHQNIRELLYAVKDIVTAERARAAAEVPADGGLPVLQLVVETPWQVAKTDDGWLISGQKIERFASRTDFGNEEAVNRLKAIMRKSGIMHELQRQGAKAGERLHIGEIGSFGL
jgi:GTP-binding protein